MTLPRWAIVALYASVAVASGFLDLRMRDFPAHPYEEYIPGVIDGTAEAPGRYRVLAPWLTHWAARVLPFSEAGAWHLTRLAWFLAAYLVMHAYLRTWGTRVQALAGTLLVAATLPLTFTNSWAHPDHVPELALFTLGALAVARGRDGLFAVALVLACLNRETAIFLVLLYAVAAPWTKERLARIVVFGALGMAVLGGLRLWRPFQHYDYWQFWRNLSFFALLPPAYDPYKRAFAYFVLVLFGPMLLVVGLRRKVLPGFPRRALLVVPPFVLTAFVFSSVIETRIFTPLYALVMPGLLAVFARADNEESRS